MTYQEALKLEADRLTKLRGRVVTAEEVAEEDRAAVRAQLRKCYEERMKDNG